MPRVISDAQKQHFFALVAQGIATNAAAKQAGISTTTAWRLTRGQDKEARAFRDRTERNEETQPDPKLYDELSTDAQEALRDFNTFGEMFLCRRPVPWRREASLRIVDALVDKSQRSFEVMNLPPGAGKSTLVHDVAAWLLAGGGVCDPLLGRAVRIMIGAQAMGVSVHYVARLKRFLESPRAFYDRFSQQTASHSIVREFGRFRPREKLAPWRDDEFTVEQLGDVDLVEKEPSVLAVSQEKAFLGERCDLAVWDDLVVGRNVSKPDVRESLAAWFTDECETRVEPGGALFLVGQRMGPDDLYRNRLDLAASDEEGEVAKQYHHIVFPAHHEASCDGNHRQWNAEEDEHADGCLLDPERLPWKELRRQMQQHSRRYTVMYQQADSDPSGVLVPLVWLDGGIDLYNEQVPGCWDKDRGFWEWPKGIDGLVDYAAVDVASSQFWAIEHWSTKGVEFPRYLIAGARRKMGANELLDWSHGTQTFSGLMEEWQQRSVDAGHPIKVWIIESNAFARHLTQYDHVHRCKKRWGVEIIPHQTQRNRSDSKLGVEALLPSLYHDGLARIPYRRGDLEIMNYVTAKRAELTTWPEGATTDTVMCQWFAEYHLQIGNVLRAGKAPKIVGLNDALPPYLIEQQERGWWEDDSWREIA